MCYNEPFRASSPPISLEPQMGCHKQPVALSTAIYTERSEVSYKRSGSAVQDEQERTQLREGATVKAS